MGGARAEIVSISTEIMLGEITDTNAAFIASQLPEFGIDLLYVTQVGDNPGRLHEVLARERSDYTFATGGLGPSTSPPDLGNRVVMRTPRFR